jgi:hypothetical protein
MRSRFSAVRPRGALNATAAMRTDSVPDVLEFEI